MQEAWRQPEQTVPECGLEPGRGASLEAHQRRSLEDVQQRPDQGDGRQRRQRHEERAGFATRNDLVRDESQHHGRHQHDQAPEQPGHQEARGVGAQPLSGEAKQIPGPGLGSGQRPIEEPRVASKRFGALGRDLGVTPFDRVHFPIAAEHARKQDHGPAVIRPERQHRARVADPPLVVLGEPHPPPAHAGRVQGVVEESGGIGTPPSAPAT